MTIQTLIEATTKLIANQLIPTIFGMAVVVFFWGLAVYVYKADEKDSQTKGRLIMTWGIIILFIMASLWGIISFWQSNLGIGGENTILPQGGNNPFE